MSTRTNAQATPPRTRTTRFAAAGLLALAMMLPLGTSANAAAVQQLIADAQVNTDTITDDVDRVGNHLSALQVVLRGEVEDAVASVEAATSEARSALDRAADADAVADGTAATALGDAQVALDAASAQLRYVTDQARTADAQVADALLRLQGHIDTLRGETSRAGA